MGHKSVLDATGDSSSFYGALLGCLECMVGAMIELRFSYKHGLIFDAQGKQYNVIKAEMLYWSGRAKIGNEEFRVLAEQSFDIKRALLELEKRKHKVEAK